MEFTAAVPDTPPYSAAAAEEEAASTRRVANRIIRALQQRQLRLLHRAGADFFVLGATGNVYTVTLSTAPACTCPDTAAPCKHVLFVLLRVLGLSLDEACVWRQSLRPCQVARLLGTPTYPDALAGTRARERFHQLWSAPNDGSSSKPDGRQQDAAASSTARLHGVAACPVCLEDMACGDGGTAPHPQQAVLTCRTCRNAVHAECFARWKRSRARRAATCVVCRSRWRLPYRRVDNEEQRYMNLAAYMNDDDAMQCDDDGGLCAG